MWFIQGACHSLWCVGLSHISLPLSCKHHENRKTLFDSVPRPMNQAACEAHLWYCALKQKEIGPSICLLWSFLRKLHVSRKPHVLIHTCLFHPPFGPTGFQIHILLLIGITLRGTPLNGEAFIISTLLHAVCPGMLEAETFQRSFYGPTIVTSLAFPPTPLLPTGSALCFTCPFWGRISRGLPTIQPPPPSPVPTVMIWTPSSYIKILQTQENLSRVAWESHRLGGQNGELAYMPKPPLLPPWGCDSTPFEGEMWDSMDEEPQEWIDALMMSLRHTFQCEN